jgi:hypothetical protein
MRTHTYHLRLLNPLTKRSDVIEVELTLEEFRRIRAWIRGDIGGSLEDWKPELTPAAKEFFTSHKII